MFLPPQSLEHTGTALKNGQVNPLQDIEEISQLFKIHSFSPHRINRGPTRKNRPE